MGTMYHRPRACPGGPLSLSRRLPAFRGDYETMIMGPHGRLRDVQRQRKILIDLTYN